MARKHPDRKQVTISLTEGEAYALDQAAFSYGLEGRSSAAAMYLRAGLAAMPFDAALVELSRQAVNQTRRHVFGETAEFFERMAKSYRDGMK